MSRFTSPDGFELIDYDMATGRSTWAKEEDGQTIIEENYPVDDIMNVNAERRSSTPQGWKGDWHHVASVPLRAAFDHGLNDAFAQRDDKFISKYLNDIDNRAWRTKDGRV